MKKQEGIYGSIRLNKQKYLDEFLILYKQGLNDTEIRGFIYYTKKMENRYEFTKKFQVFSKI